MNEKRKAIQARMNEITKTLDLNPKRFRRFVINSDWNGIIVLKADDDEAREIRSRAKENYRFVSMLSHAGNFRTFQIQDKRPPGRGIYPAGAWGKVITIHCED